ncbi:MAG: hypothetical protein AAB355_01010 [Patescibacteria group bacterium]
MPTAKYFVQIEGETDSQPPIPKMADWSAEMSYPLNPTELRSVATEKAKKENLKEGWSIVHLQRL